jgi:hypothetical protein
MIHKLSEALADQASGSPRLPFMLVGEGAAYLADGALTGHRHPRDDETGAGMTTRITRCLSPRCGEPGEHYDDCDGTRCRGCVPRQTAPGKTLCRECTRQLGRDIPAVAALDRELLERLTGTSAGGEGGKTSNPPGSRQPDDRPLWARAEIRNALASWTRIVCEERNVATPARLTVRERPLGFTGPMPVIRVPDDSTIGLAAFLVRHLDWLAGHNAADELADTFAELAHGRARRIAYPSGARVVEIAPCPCLVGADRCEGVIKAIVRPTDALLPTELVCDVDDTHRWSSTQWTRLRRQLRAAA